ncbi:MAG: sialidase family protein [Candidatus Kapaibacteriota bacterium]
MKSLLALCASIALYCSLFSANLLHAQTASAVWTRIAAPPPRITGIAAMAETVWISTESGAYSLTGTQSTWTFQPSVPPGRLMQSSTTEILCVGAQAWVLPVTASFWRISTNAAHTALAQNLPRSIVVVTQATVRMPEGFDVLATSGDVSIRKGEFERPIYSLLDGSARIIGMVRSGGRLYCATERGILCGEVITGEKVNPLELLPRTRIVWKHCNDGLQSMVDNLQGVGNRALVQNAWFAPRFSEGDWRFIAQDSLRVLLNVPTRDSALLALSSRNILRSRDLGKSWSNAGAALSRTMRWFSDVRQRSLAPCLVGTGGTLTLFAQDTALRTLGPTHVVESRDGGLTWQQQEIRGLPDNVALSNIVQSPRGSLFARDGVFSRTSLFRSNDGGRTWQTLAIGRMPEMLAAHPTTGTLIVSGSPPMRSDDNGTTWTAVQGLPFRTSGRFEGRTEAVFSTNNVVLLNIQGVGGFRSSDGGRTFFRQAMPAQNLYRLRSAPSGEVFAFGADTANGRARTLLWSSLNGGTTWERLETGFPDQPSFLLTDIIAGSDGTVYALSTHGIFRLQRRNALQKAFQKVALLTSVQEIGAVSSLQFAPNPAQHLASLAFVLPVPAFVRCEVVNMLGASMGAVFEGELPSGEQRLSLNVANMPSGQYGCRLTVVPALGQPTVSTIPFLVQR